MRSVILRSSVPVYRTDTQYKCTFIPVSAYSAFLFSSEPPRGAATAAGMAAGDETQVPVHNPTRGGVPRSVHYDCALHPMKFESSFRNISHIRLTPGIRPYARCHYHAPGHTMGACQAYYGGKGILWQYLINKYIVFTYHIPVSSLLLARPHAPGPIYEEED